MWAYFFLIAMLLIIVVSAVYGLVLSKKKPAYISENKDGTFSVFVWVRRFNWEYREYLFVKCGNGKFKMRYGIYDVFCIALSIFQLLLGTFIIFCFRDEFIKQPDVFPALVGFFLWLFFNVVWANWALLEAQICLKKNLESLNE